MRHLVTERWKGGIRVGVKQIDLEPERYRVRGRSRIIRSVLHKPVFMTISTALGAWVALTLGVVYQYEGFARVPYGLALWLYPSLLVAPAFFLWAALNDEDRPEPASRDRKARAPLEHSEGQIEPSAQRRVGQ